MSVIYSIYYDGILVAKQENPNGVFVKYATKLPELVFGLDGSREGTHKMFVRWLSGRMFPPERLDAAELLRELGLPKYDVIEIAKKTRGTSPKDLFSITWEDYDD